MPPLYQIRSFFKHCSKGRGYWSPKCIYAKCTRLVCLLSFASLFILRNTQRYPSHLQCYIHLRWCFHCMFDIILSVLAKYRQLLPVRGQISWTVPTEPLPGKLMMQMGKHLGTIPLIVRHSSPRHSLPKTFIT